MPKMSNRLLPSLRRVVLVRESAERTDGQLLTAFLVDRDGDAFAALVHRHGPMVLGVSRRVIGDPHIADDAFQAVFLVLARRAAAVRPREQVGNWLYGVAYRTAMKARTVLARRRSREKQVDAMPEPPAPATPDWNDVQPLIDEELARLPAKLRLPVVLCDLEGRPQRAVASQLGIAPATLASRIATARRLLASRLSRRGITLSGGALAVALGERASAATVAPPLADATVRAAEAVAAGATTSGLSGLVSAHAIQLCEGVMRMMLLSKLKTATITAVAAVVLTSGLGFGLMPAQAGDEPPPAVVQNRPTQAPRHTKTAEPLTDPEFLRRLCLDLTGSLPNLIEMQYFTADLDKNKRAKVVDWLVADETVKMHIAKKLGVPVERIQVLHAADDKGHTIKLAIVADPSAQRPKAVAFSPDGNNLTVGVDDYITRVWDRNTGKSISVTQEGFRTIQASDSTAAASQFFSAIDLGRPAPNVVWNAIQNYTAQPPATATNKPSSTKDLSLWIADVQPHVDFEVWAGEGSIFLVDGSDSDFLKRATQAARGSNPTALEEKYFTEDKDPKKREKLLDLFLKDPAVAKKLGDEWKKKMLEPNVVTAKFKDARGNQPYYVPLQPTNTLEIEWLNATPSVTLKAGPGKFDRLVNDLIAAKKSDEQMLEAVALAAAGRLPTPEEKKATLAVIGTLTDKKAAWVAIAQALAPQEKKPEDKKPAPEKK